MAEKICERLASGEPLRAICRDEGMPPRKTVAQWVIDDVEGFAARYARAREVGFDELAEEVLSIADTPQEGEEREESADGIKIKRGDMLGHRRLQVDARKWLLSKLLPHKYGDKQVIDMNVSGPLAERLARARARNNG